MNRSDPPPPNGACVLVIDDALAVRASVERALRGQGFEVLLASDALAGLALLQQRPDVGLVFTDLQMNGMQGTDLIRRLKQEPQLAHIPVAVLTASPHALAEVDRHTLVACLAKPVSARAVVTIARRVCGVEPQPDR